MRQNLGPNAGPIPSRSLCRVLAAYDADGTPNAMSAVW